MLFATPTPPQPALSRWSRVWRYLVAAVVGLAAWAVDARRAHELRARAGAASWSC